MGGVKRIKTLRDTVQVPIGTVLYIVNAGIICLLLTSFFQEASSAVPGGGLGGSYGSSRGFECAVFVCALVCLA